MDTLDVIDTASATAKKLRVVLAALGDIDPDNEILDGSIGILWDIYEIINNLSKIEIVNNNTGKINICNNGNMGDISAKTGDITVMVMV